MNTPLHHVNVVAILAAAIAGLWRRVVCVVVRTSVCRRAWPGRCAQDRHSAAALPAMNMAINPNIQRHIVYGVLSAGYFMVSSMTISITLFLLS